jgi:hypothetical protein
MALSNIPIREQLVKTVVQSGNGGAVWVPKSWRGEEVVVTLPRRPAASPKERVLLALKPYFNEIVSAGIVGSHARGEQSAESDIDVLLITENKHISAKLAAMRIDAVCLPPEKANQAVAKYPILYHQMVKEADSLINGAFLSRLKSISPSKKGMRAYVRETQDQLKSSQGLIELDKLDSPTVQSYSAIYSTMLRLKGVYVLTCILASTTYSNRNFAAWLIKKGMKREEFLDCYSSYRSIKEGKPTKPTISVQTAEKLLAILRQESDKALRRL